MIDYKQKLWGFGLFAAIKDNEKETQDQNEKIFTAKKRIEQPQFGKGLGCSIRRLLPSVRRKYMNYNPKGTDDEWSSSESSLSSGFDAFSDAARAPDPDLAPASSIPFSRNSGPEKGGEVWGVEGEMAIDKKIEGIDYPFEDGSYYDSMAKNALSRSIKSSLQEIILLGIPDEDNPNKESRQEFERDFCLKRLQEIDTTIAPGDIKYYKRFGGPRVPGSPKPMAVGMKKEDVAQVLISTAEARCYDKIKRSWPKIQRINGKAYAYKRHGNGKIEVVVHPNPKYVPQYLLKEPLKGFLVASS